MVALPPRGARGLWRRMAPSKAVVDVSSSVILDQRILSAFAKVRRGVQTAEESLDLFKRIEAGMVLLSAGLLRAISAQLPSQ